MKKKYYLGRFELPLQLIHIEAFKQGKIQVIDAKASCSIKFFDFLTEARNFIHKCNKNGKSFN